MEGVVTPTLKICRAKSSMQSECNALLQGNLLNPGSFDQILLLKSKSSQAKFSKGKPLTPPPPKYNEVVVGLVTWCTCQSPFMYISNDCRLSSYRSFRVLITSNTWHFSLFLLQAVRFSALGSSQARGARHTNLDGGLDLPPKGFKFMPKNEIHKNPAEDCIK